MPAFTTSDYYPPEICERMYLLPGGLDASASEQQKRVGALIENHDIGKTFRALFAGVFGKDITSGSSIQFQNNFWQFLEEAADLIDQQPYGSKLGEGGRATFELTQRGEMVAALTSATNAAQKLKRVLPSIAPTIAGTLPIDEARTIIAQMDKLVAACVHESFKLTTKIDGDHVFPPPSPGAKRDNYSNWLLRKLHALAYARLEAPYDAGQEQRRLLPLVIEVHRTLLEHIDKIPRDPVDQRAAEFVIGIAPPLPDLPPETRIGEWFQTADTLPR